MYLFTSKMRKNNNILCIVFIEKYSNKNNQKSIEILSTPRVKRKKYELEVARHATTTRRNETQCIFFNKKYTKKCNIINYC